MKKFIITFLVLGCITSVFAYCPATTMMMTTTIPIMIMMSSANSRNNTHNKVNDTLIRCRNNGGGNACYVNHCKSYGGGAACNTKCKGL